MNIYTCKTGNFRVPVFLVQARSIEAALVKARRAMLAWQRESTLTRWEKAGEFASVELVGELDG